MHNRYIDIKMLDFNPFDEKTFVFEKVNRFLKSNDLSISKTDQTRPWGGFYVIDEDFADKFISLFFPDFQFKKEREELKISPKILIIAPEKKLSWQYHHRRSEVWKIISGEAGVVISDSDELSEIMTKKTGEIVRIAQGQRHRLIGLQNWAIIAEIWQHTDSAHPSNEEDIIRLDDDFGRK